MEGFFFTEEKLQKRNKKRTEETKRGRWLSFFSFFLVSVERVEGAALDFFFSLASSSWEGEERGCNQKEKGGFGFVIFGQCCNLRLHVFCACVHLFISPFVFSRLFIHVLVLALINPWMKRVFFINDQNVSLWWYVPLAWSLFLTWRYGLAISYVLFGLVI